VHAFVRRQAEKAVELTAAGRGTISAQSTRPSAAIEPAGAKTIAAKFTTAKFTAFGASATKFAGTSAA
jgi:hypothetical protein